jgi:hypothetical protein
MKHSVAHITSQHTFSHELTNLIARDALTSPPNIGPNLIFGNFGLPSSLAFERLISLP